MYVYITVLQSVFLFNLVVYFCSQDLQGQNDLMVQTKKLLEQKATSLSAKTDTMDDLQEELASLKVRVESFQEEKDMDNEKIEELLAVNTRLEMDVKH